MPAIRFRAHGWVCNVLLTDVPDIGDTAYVKNKLKVSGSPSWSPVRFLGFVCQKGALSFTWARRGKLIACAVSNGNGVSGEWKELGDQEYVEAKILQLGEATFGAYAIVDKNLWPIVKSETRPLLTIVRDKQTAKIIGFTQEATAESKLKKSK
jgi:hypothetical protein